MHDVHPQQSKEAEIRGKRNEQNNKETEHITTTNIKKLVMTVINVPIAEVGRGIFPCPFMYTNNLSLLGSRSQDDL